MTKTIVIVPVTASLDGEPEASAFSAPQEIYFPLPANREQRRIVEAISHRRGVLVQGPPGTGKSHTIANLVCHLLASGKKVLITAETGRALKVLKSKLPEDIQPLCVSLLGQGGDAFAELNAAVQGITSRFATWTPGAYDERIAEVERELDARRRALAKIDTELRSLREDETYPHSLMSGAYMGTASAIARRVADERRHSVGCSCPATLLTIRRPAVPTCGRGCRSGASMMKTLSMRQRCTS